MEIAKKEVLRRDRTQIAREHRDVEPTKGNFYSPLGDWSILGGGAGLGERSSQQHPGARARQRPLAVKRLDPS